MDQSVDGDFLSRGAITCAGPTYGQSRMTDSTETRARPPRQRAADGRREPMETRKKVSLEPSSRLDRSGTVRSSGRSSPADSMRPSRWAWRSAARVAAAVREGRGAMKEHPAVASGKRAVRRDLAHLTRQQVFLLADGRHAVRGSDRRQGAYARRGETGARAVARVAD